MFQQSLFQIIMLQHEPIVRQESPTQPYNHPMIVIVMNENKCRTMELGMSKIVRYFSILNQMSRNL